MSGHYVPNGNGGWNYVGGYQEPTYLLELQRKEQLMNYINPNWGDRQQEYLEETIADQEARDQLIEEYEGLREQLESAGVTITREGYYVDFTISPTNAWILHTSGKIIAWYSQGQGYELIQLSQRWLAIEQQLREAGAI